ncbi:histone deacetylase family protein [Shimia sp. R9_1]|uniref:histone deacetylase family protein n=1 Tax=Shimia sp. R9_1 TaxID=2821111 RepID=UPI001ADBD2EA|nr:histone deacetylase family protein [Shimia sp. R9_1]MBO9407464.1 histone deacetylase family protein [Shimia sp. R9_1]
MTTALFGHESSLGHVTPSGHPEQVARIEHIMAALKGPSFAALDRRDAPACSDDDILLCHPQTHLDAIAAAAPANGTVALDADTHMSPGSLAAARHAVGGCIAAVDAVLTGEVSNAFVACRPPGHHAETSTPMGFCLFGNAAIAVKHALERHGLSRVAVVDFDVHHGNGTQDLLWNESRSLFVGSHQNPLWPGTGMPEETGGHNNVMNLPLPPHSDGRLMRATYEAEVFPALARFEPELVIISAGFDAHADDPLAQLNWREDDFAWLTERLCDVVDQHAEGRVVSTLEGGYDLNALAASVAAHVSVLMERAG